MKIMNNLPDYQGQQAQLSWLQSSDGGWFYFLDEKNARNIKQSQDDSEHIWLVCQESSAHKVTGYRIENHAIEMFIEQLAAVNRVAVIGVPHELKGNAIYVYVEAKYSDIDLNTLSAAISAKLAGAFGEFSRPEQIHFVDELPVVSSKRECRQQLKMKTINLGFAA